MVDCKPCATHRNIIIFYLNLYFLLHCIPPLFLNIKPSKAPLPVITLNYINIPWIPSIRLSPSLPPFLIFLNTFLFPSPLHDVSLITLHVGSNDKLTREKFEKICNFFLSKINIQSNLTSFNVR